MFPHPSDTMLCPGNSRAWRRLCNSSSGVARPFFPLHSLEAPRSFAEATEEPIKSFTHQQLLIKKFLAEIQWDLFLITVSAGVSPQSESVLAEDSCLPLFFPGVSDWDQPLLLAKTEEVVGQVFT